MPTITSPELDRILDGRVKRDMSFNEKVYTLCAKVPAGKVVTYGDIARKLGTEAFRAVGNAMNRNPYAPTVPCHRVVGSDGSLTGFASGVDKKKKLLEGEGVAFKGERVDLNASRYEL